MSVIKIPNEDKLSISVLMTTYPNLYATIKHYLPELTKQQIANSNEYRKKYLQFM